MSFKDWLEMKIKDITNSISSIDEVSGMIENMSSTSIYSGDRNKAHSYVSSRRNSLVNDLEIYTQYLNNINTKKYERKAPIRFVIIRNDANVSKIDVESLGRMMLIRNVLQSNDLYNLNYNRDTLFIATGILTNAELECIKFCMHRRFDIYARTSFFSWDGEDIRSISTGRYARNLKITDVEG